MIGGYQTALMGVIAGYKLRDPNFSNVLLLLDGSGTITTDSSSFNRALGTTGTPTLDSGVALFGQPTYEINNGALEFVSINSETFIETELTSGEFCAEIHARPEGTGADTRFAYYGNFEWRWAATGNFSATAVIGGTSYSISSSDNSGTANNWHHVAFVRDKSDPTFDYLKLYVDGQLKATSAAFGKSSVIGPGGGIRRLIGYSTTGAYGRFTNLRLTKATARYYSNFTPPSAPYPKA